MASKSERIELRVSPEHKALLEDAAAMLGQTVSSFMVSEGIEQAKRVHQTALSRRDWNRFLAIMDSVDEPTPALRTAVEEHRVEEHRADEPNRSS